MIESTWKTWHQPTFLGHSVLFRWALSGRVCLTLSLVSSSSCSRRNCFASSSVDPTSIRSGSICWMRTRIHSWLCTSQSSSASSSPSSSSLSPQRSIITTRDARRNISLSFIHSGRLKTQYWTMWDRITRMERYLFQWSSSYSLQFYVFFAAWVLYELYMSVSKSFLVIRASMRHTSQQSSEVDASNELDKKTNCTYCCPWLKAQLKTKTACTWCQTPSKRRTDGRTVCPPVRPSVS